MGYADDIAHVTDYNLINTSFPRYSFYIQLNHRLYQIHEHTYIIDKPIL